MIVYDSFTSDVWSRTCPATLSDHSGLWRRGRRRRDPESKGRTLPLPDLILRTP